MRSLKLIEFNNFCNTTGKLIAEDYQKIGGSLRSVSRKYGITKKYIRHIG